MRDMGNWPQGTGVKVKQHSPTVITVRSQVNKGHWTVLQHLIV